MYLMRRNAFKQNKAFQIHNLLQNSLNLSTRAKFLPWTNVCITKFCHITYRFIFTLQYCQNILQKYMLVIPAPVLTRICNLTVLIFSDFSIENSKQNNYRFKTVASDVQELRSSCYIKGMEVQRYFSQKSLLLYFLRKDKFMLVVTLICNRG